MKKVAQKSQLRKDILKGVERFYQFSEQGEKQFFDVLDKTYKPTPVKDGEINLGDAVSTLRFLFLEDVPHCLSVPGAPETPVPMEGCESLGPSSVRISGFRSTN